MLAPLVGSGSAGSASTAGSACLADSVDFAGSAGSVLHSLRAPQPIPDICQWVCLALVIAYLHQWAHQDQMIHRRARCQVHLMEHDDQYSGHDKGAAVAGRLAIDARTTTLVQELVATNGIPFASVKGMARNLVLWH